MAEANAANEDLEVKRKQVLKELEEAREADAKHSELIKVLEKRCPKRRQLKSSTMPRRRFWRRSLPRE